MLTQLPDGVTVKRRLRTGSPCRSQQHSITPQPISNETSNVNLDWEAIPLEDILADIGPVSGQDVIMHGRAMRSSSIGSRPVITSSANQSDLQISPPDAEALPGCETSYEPVDLEVDFGNTFSTPGSSFWDSWTGQLSPGVFLPSLQSTGMFVIC